MRTLPREPWRGSQICGWQIAYGGWGSSPMAFCGERKADGYYLCQEHQGQLEESGEFLEFDANVALGMAWRAPRLLWEPLEGDVPEEPSWDEMARYAGAQAGGE